MEVLITILGVGAIQFLVGAWIKARLEKSIEHEYAKKLEDYRQQILKREKAAQVAEMFSLWLKYRGREAEFLDKKQLIDYYESLNRMSLELSLWVEDEALLQKLMKRFLLDQEAPNVRELIIEFRDLILASKGKSFEAHEIVLWPPNQETFFSKGIKD